MDVLAKKHGVNVVTFQVKLDCGRLDGVHSFPGSGTGLTSVPLRKFLNGYMD